jgi:hypothetical protein
VNGGKQIWQARTPAYQGKAEVCRLGRNRRLVTIPDVYAGRKRAAMIKIIGQTEAYSSYRITVFSG